ncbi:MAG: phosphoglycerate dehydrogenase [Actinomycetota bacterium]
MIEVAITPRSFRQTPGPHHDLLEKRSLKARFPDSDAPLSAGALAAFVTGCPALIVGTDEVDAQVMDAGPLEIVVKYGTGMDNVDIGAARARGVRVESTAGANSRSVAELTLGLMLALARNIAWHDRGVRSGSWARHTGLELEGKRLGIVGFGSVGRKVARIARALGMEVIIHDPYVNAGIGHSSLREVLSNSDVVSLHLPLNDETRGVIGGDELALMKAGALLVNTARGGLVDEEALAVALEAGRLGGAAFDVFSTEPPGDSPLLHLENFIASPHTGAATHEAIRRASLEAVEKVVALFATEAQ